MKRLYLFILILIPLVSCKDKSLHPDLPPATHNGANTLGFKVNGENWVPHYTGISLQGDREVSMGYNKQTGGFGITANREFDKNEINQTINIGIIHLFSSGDCYNAEQLNNLYFYNQNKFYYKYSKDGHFLITKLDTVNQIISGTFDFTLLNGDGEEVHITDGRFDFHYPYVK